jgi:hypothetical protein
VAGIRETPEGFSGRKLAVQFRKRLEIRVQHDGGDAVVTIAVVIKSGGRFGSDKSLTDSVWEI